MVESVGIESIEETGRKEVVYDLDHVEPDHLYLVEDGLVAHNCMDEFSEATNKQDENYKPGQEEDIIETFSDVSRRMESRFREFGSTAGKLFLVSSKKEENAPLEGYIEDLKDKGLDESVMIVNKPIWYVKPWEYTQQEPSEEVTEWEPEKEDTVALCKGSVNELPQVLESEQDVEKHRKAGHEIIQIPNTTDIVRAFKRNPIKAFRDYIGEDPASDRKRNFLPRPEILDRQVSMTLPNLFGDGVIELGEQFRNLPLNEFFDPTKAMNQGAPRAVHVDLSKSQDSTGISMVHYIPLDALDRDIPGRERMFITDFCLEIKPFSGDKIPIPNIRRFIYDLIVEFGFNIQKITFDGYQSVSVMQELRMSERIDTDRITIENLSVDENRGPYDLLRGTIRDGTIILVNQETVKGELKGLIDTGTKWDHPSGGSKDVSDSLAGAVWNASDLEDTNQLASGDILTSMVEEMKKSKMREDVDEPIEDQLSTENVAEEQGKRHSSEDRKSVKDKSDAGQLTSILDDMIEERS